MKYADEAIIVGFALKTRNDNGNLYVTCPEGRVNIQPELERFAELIEAKAEKNLLLEMDVILLNEYQKLNRTDEAGLEIYEAVIRKVRSMSKTATSNVQKVAKRATIQEW